MFLKDNPNNPPLKRFLNELAAFAYHNAVSCMFPLFIFFILWGSNYISFSPLYRYDVLLIAALAFQIFMFKSRLETKKEVLIITVFHLLGLTMEIFKVQHGSWAYPDFAWTKVAGVPLFAGFMYASVASYMTQAWRRLNLKLINWPNSAVVTTIAILIYVNFFTHHYIADIRWFLVAAILVVFYKTIVEYSNNGPKRKMPMVLTFALIGLFVWFAEHIATYLGAWQYPYQQDGWSFVHLSKLSSWALLVIVSFLVVAQLQFKKKRDS